MFEAKMTLENGLAIRSKFDTYAKMCQWLACNAQAGIEAWEDGEAIDQRQLQEDVEQYL